MPGVYDYPCPECGGRINSTARMIDCTQAPTFCENDHQFMRSAATDPKTNPYMLVSAHLDGATETAIEVAKREFKRSRRPSTAHLILELSDKHGLSENEIRTALGYIQVHRKELGIPNTVYPDPEMLSEFRRFRAYLKEHVGAATVQALNPVTRMSQPMSGSQKEEADMKAEFGQMPPFTAKLEAVKRLTASLARTSTELTAEMLMARTTQVSRIADKGMDDIVEVMRQLGYEARTTQNKALYTTVFTHEGEPEHTFEMVGWHGTGKFAGGEKTILEFYDDDHSTEKPVVAIGVINEANINPNRQKEVVQDILDYVKNHG